MAFKIIILNPASGEKKLKQKWMACLDKKQMNLLLDHSLKSFCMSETIKIIQCNFIAAVTVHRDGSLFALPFVSSASPFQIDSLTYSYGSLFSELPVAQHCSQGFNYMLMLFIRRPRTTLLCGCIRQMAFFYSETTCVSLSG